MPVTTGRAPPETHGQPWFRPEVVLVTGAAGFIGSNFVRWLLQGDPDVRIVSLDALTYAGNLESLADACAAAAGGRERHFFIHGDVRDAPLVELLLRGGAAEPTTGRAAPRPDAVIHLAAESHVDRSILGGAEFVATNVLGTYTLLEATRRELAAQPREFRFINVSTDEVYGSLAPDAAPFTEAKPLAPNSPYSASKAGADHLIRAYRESFDLPCITTRCSNNYGPYQFPEKLIPLVITRALADQAVPVFGDGLQVRDWIHVEDHVEALWTVCTKGRLSDEVYNIGGKAERRNVDVVREILRILGKPDSLIRFVRDRSGHDRRYAMDIARIERSLGWTPRMTFGQSLESTVEWYVGNADWWERVLSEAYRATRSLYLVGEQ